MAIPSGSGTEVLKRTYIDGQANSEGTLLTGVANHIYTIISIILVNRDSSTRGFDLYVDPSAGGTDFFILDSVSIPTKDTYVFSDKFVLTGTDKLHIIADASSNFDIICSYIDQDFS